MMKTGKTGKPAEMAVRRHRVAALLTVLALTLAACADPRPPTGRWEGVYEDQGVIIVARLEITPDGKVRVTAPNAITGGEALSEGDRASLLRKLQAGLDVSWPSVTPLPLEFDGSVFRKPGGVAPQLEWDAQRRRMTMIYYSGNRSSVRVALTSVGEFGASNS